MEQENTHFFNPKGMKASDYDVIAFDMDLTLAEYKMKSFIRLLFASVAAQLINHQGYPKDLFPGDDEEETFYCRFHRGVIDLVSGLVSWI